MFRLGSGSGFRLWFGGLGVRLTVVVSLRVQA